MHHRRREAGLPGYRAERRVDDALARKQRSAASSNRARCSGPRALPVGLPGRRAASGAAAGSGTAAAVVT
jgi:hypothetical protein